MNTSWTTCLTISLFKLFNIWLIVIFMQVSEVIMEEDDEQLNKDRNIDEIDDQM